MPAPRSMLVLDFRRPVSPQRLRGRLRLEHGAPFLATTPYAAWALERQGESFETLDQAADLNAVCRHSADLFARIQTVLDQANGAPDPSLYGFVHPLARLLCHGMREASFAAALGSGPVRLWTDTPRLDHPTAEQLLSNRAELTGIVPAEQIELWPRRRQSVRQSLRFLRKITWRKLQRRLAPGLRADAPARTRVVCDDLYDWEPVRRELLPDEAVVSFRALAQQLRSLPPPTGPSGQLQAPFSRRLCELCSQLTIDPGGGLRTIIEARFQDYLDFRARCRSGLPDLARRQSIRLALATPGSEETFLICFYLRAAGIPACYYQHGAYYLRNPVVPYFEIAPASLNLVFGDGDREFFAASPLSRRTAVVGSTLLDRLRPAGPVHRHRFLYVLNATRGSDHTDEAAYVPSLDGVEMFHRHCRVLELFGRYRSAQLVVRPHPGQYAWALYEPLREFVQERKLRNVVVDDRPLEADDFLQDCEWLILDYCCTTLMQALAKGNANLVCYTGHPYRPRPEDAALLQQALHCEDTEAGLLARLDTILEGGALPAVSPAARQELERLYGRRVGPPGTLALVHACLREQMDAAMPESTEQPQPDAVLR